MERIRYFLNIEPGEERPIFLLFLYLTLALASFTIARAIRDSLFLNHYGAMDLPYAYIAVAVVIGIVVSFYVKLASHLNQAALISGTLLFFILNILVFWWVMPRRWDLLPAIFYVWSSIFGVIITAQVWTVGGMILDTRQARRLFPLLGSGGILGGFLGGLIAALAVRLAGTEDLILILLLFPACCIVIVQKLSKLFCRNCRVCQRAQSAVDSIQGERGLLPIVQMIHRSRYLRLIVALFALSAVVTLLVDFQFKLVVQDTIPLGDALTGFFGSFYAWMGFISFLLQIVAGRWIVDKYGIRLTLLILPIALLSGTVILLAFPMRLWAGLFLKGSDGTLRYSIDKSTIELLFVPIPKEV
ncbi:MAG: Npt1/Npt2 family nucleotide transporter, partial [Acidobacteriota bacterium]|nr:Npt1/Npt2 family nucleotide transporter [Acidobacteriota bacterium]